MLKTKEECEWSINKSYLGISLKEMNENISFGPYYT